MNAELSFEEKCDLLDELLCQAVVDDNIEKVHELLSKGANAKCNDNDPLRLACYTFNVRIAKMLIKAGADRADNKCISFVTKKNHEALYSLLRSGDNDRL